MVLEVPYCPADRALGQLQLFRQQLIGADNAIVVSGVVGQEDVQLRRCPVVDQQCDRLSFLAVDLREPRAFHVRDVGSVRVRHIGHSRFGLRHVCPL